MAIKYDKILGTLREDDAGGLSSGTVTTVKDEGVNLSTAVTSIDFVGAGVTATGTTAVTVTIPGGGGSTPTGTGFTHITASAQDAAAKLVDTADINDAQVTLAKMANMATASLIYRKTVGSGVPEVNTLATLKTDLGLTGTNSGDQASIVGITGTTAQFNTALTDGDFATGGGTATGTNTGDQSLFSTIAVSGQSNVVADATSDTLTLVAGTNVTITTNATTDSITIAAAGGGGSATWTETELDFGSTPVGDKTFTITDAACTAVKNVSVLPSGKPATSRVGNDFEWDQIIFSVLPGSGTFALTANVVNGKVVGSRKVIYQIGT